jgi:O-acetyl-ADP-ribose deacetylase (regulator of RNase III)
MILRAEGDLFTCGVPVIAHGCNCHGVMGAGIATQFRDRYPRMYEAYRYQCASCMFMPGDVFSWLPEQGGLVFNLATQYAPGANAQPWMITTAVGRMLQLAHYTFNTTRIAIPEIGCGLGGLAREDLDTALAPYQNAPVDLVVVTYKPSGGSSG